MIKIEEIIEDFSYAQEWEDKYTYLIELGNKIPMLSKEEMIEENKVSGCMSNVWVVMEKSGDIYNFKSNSDASIVRGLAAIIASIFSDRTSQEIAELNVDEYFLQMDILENISPNRRNGLYSMASLIKAKVATN